MTLEEKYLLSCYKEIDKISDKKEIYIVKNIDTDELFVKKILDLYSKPVYEALSSGNYPNTPKIVAIIEDENKLIVIEEYIHGKNLDQILRECGRLNQQDVINTAISLCDILSALHRQPHCIIHRDIKPSNIMISNDGVVKLVDFNAAKKYTCDKPEDTVLIGTKDFAAPEQYGFGHSEPRTDIYGIGSTINYLICGKSVNEQKISGVLAPIVHQCTQLDVDKRYENVEQLRNALIACKNSANFTSFKKSLSKTDFIPPGFRSGKLWKMLISILGYFCVALFSFATDVEFEGSNPKYYQWEQFCFNLSILLWMLSNIALIFNYVDIRSKLPGFKFCACKSPIITVLYSLILISLYSFAFLFMFVFFCVAIMYIVEIFL